MPELPEVETIARCLNSCLPGRVISSVECRYSGCIRGNAQAYTTGLEGRRIKAVWRRAKLLLMDLDQEQHLVFHLKMTGKLLFSSCWQGEVDKHTHLIFNFADQEKLAYQDQRKFGYSAFLTGQELQSWPFFASLGPEPLTLDVHGFRRIFGRTRARVKAVLLDQQRIAGIGNIYADEALHLAGIHPATQSHVLSAAGLSRLHASLLEVLTRALDVGGTSFRDYVDGLGRPGRYQDEFNVYGRTGLPCRQCGRDLEKTVVAGRTSVFCPACQPGRWPG